MAAKIGVPFAFASQKIKEGYTWAEVQYLYSKEQAPAFLHNGKKVLSSSLKSFHDWFSPTFDKLQREVHEDVKATWVCAATPRGSLPIQKSGFWSRPKPAAQLPSPVCSGVASITSETPMAASTCS